ncbi:hypothetical protein J6TS1_27940 [Siminovitchia terrae]|uniref:Uncharacterized protein n=1 Tax=Siminovitchia terrae TaxID=1914933 RepID=A0ABQ4KZ45_SIMTE|nr:hypothetical protein J6TS1_27940 [Siminovitchia terrae]
MFLANTSNLSKNYILSGFIRELERLSPNLKDQTVQSYSLRECSKELKLLRVYSLPMMSDLISEFDSTSMSKLLYLILLLDGKSGSPEDRHMLFRCLANGKHQ